MPLGPKCQENQTSCRQRHLLERRAQGIQIHACTICQVNPSTDPRIETDVDDEHNPVLIHAAPVACSGQGQQVLLASRQHCVCRRYQSELRSALLGPARIQAVQHLMQYLRLQCVLVSGDRKLHDQLSCSGTLLGCKLCWRGLLSISRAEEAILRASVPSRCSPKAPCRPRRSRTRCTSTCPKSVQRMWHL